MGSTLKKLGGLVVDPLGITGIFDTSGDEAEERRKQEEARQAAYQAEQTRLREQKRSTSLNLLGGMKAPVQSDATKRRIAALESESKDGPLVSDALFQGDRANLVQGGSQALASVQNTQRAAGTSGGFSNQGSVNDVMDRLGAGLAQLGQSSRAVKEEKRGQAADLEQAGVDAQIAYENAQTQARIAIENGDADLAMQYLQEAYNAKNQIEQNYNQAIAAADQKRQQRIGQIVGGATTAAGFALGGPAGGMAGSKLGNAIAGGGTPLAQDDTASEFRKRFAPTYANSRGIA